MKTVPRVADRRTSAREGAGLVLLYLAAIAAAGILRLGSLAPFRPYFGDLDPFLVLTAVSLLGLAALASLRLRGWFWIGDRAETGSGLARAAVIAAAFAGPVILVDVLGGFPPTMNVRVPEAFLFYPAIALVAEVVFHLAPLALLLLLLDPLRDRIGRARAAWVAIVLVSLIEPVFHVVREGNLEPLQCPGVNAVHPAPRASLADIPAVRQALHARPAVSVSGGKASRHPAPPARRRA